MKNAAEIVEEVVNEVAETSSKTKWFSTRNMLIAGGAVAVAAAVVLVVKKIRSFQDDE
jgi:hypothetical protein